MVEPKAGLAAAARLLVTAMLMIAGLALLPVQASMPETPDIGLDRPDSELFPLGAAVYKAHCAACHDTGLNKAPQKIILRNMPPDAVHRSLTTGSMRAQGSVLSSEEKIAVSQHLAEREFTAQAETREPKMCEGRHAAFDLHQPPVFSGWGLDPAGTHSIPSRQAGIDRSNVADLKLKWAFGFPDATRVRSQPALAGGALYIGSHTGTVFALDRETGCVRWSFDAPAEVRHAIVVSPWQAGDTTARPLAFFGDSIGNAFAVNALTGELIWRNQVGDHPAAVLTASPALYGDVLYVPVSSLEEASAASPDYQCCTFRGSVVALDAATGEEKWRTYLVEEPELQAPDANGNRHYGPSGAAVWNTPAIDAERDQLYIATSNNYSQPASDMSDAVVALDLETGAVKWHYQTIAGDAWNVACLIGGENCPENAGPDFGFGAGTILARSEDGTERVLAGQKSGWAFALDPDTGKLAWSRRVGRGGLSAGIYFGMAAVNGHLFVPVTDRPDGEAYDLPARPGLYALDIASGEYVWHAPATNVCQDRPPACDPGYGSAITATSELVFVGADDGYLRIFDAATGEVLRTIDVVRPFPTVNQFAAEGGAIAGGAAPIADSGQLIVTSGYGFGSKMPGNVLLVYETQ